MRPKLAAPISRSCAGVGQHARVRQSTAAKKEGGSLVRGTEESDRIAALASAQTEVRAGAVLPGSGGPEHQTTGAVPQPTDNTYYGSRRLAEVDGTTGLQGYGEEFPPITDFFTHACLHQLHAVLPTLGHYGLRMPMVSPILRLVARPELSRVKLTSRPTRLKKEVALAGKTSPF